MAVKAWMAGTVDGGDKNGGKEIMSGITGESRAELG